MSLRVKLIIVFVVSLSVMTGMEVYHHNNAATEDDFGHPLNEAYSFTGRDFIWYTSETVAFVSGLFLYFLNKRN